MILQILSLPHLCATIVNLGLPITATAASASSFAIPIPAYLIDHFTLLWPYRAPLPLEIKFGVLRLPVIKFKNPFISIN